MNAFKLLIRGALMLSMLAGAGLINASDHDDGVSDVKTQALNLTDLYVFREDNQTGKSSDNENLILIMNSSPRSLPKQQYFFSTEASYQFHLTRVAAGNKNETPTGQTDIVLSFMFGQQDENGQQPITVTAIRDGETVSATTTANGTQLLTTTLQGSKAGDLVNNTVTLDGQELTVFAGLREDPFFFDVQQFFKVRAGAAGLGPKVGFLPPSEAEDFANGYNVNSIVVRVPISFLQGDAEEPIFDVWETVFINQ